MVGPEAPAVSSYAFHNRPLALSLTNCCNGMAVIGAAPAGLASVLMASAKAGTTDVKSAAAMARCRPRSAGRARHDHFPTGANRPDTCTHSPTLRRPVARSTVAMRRPPYEKGMSKTRTLRWVGGLGIGPSAPNRPPARATENRMGRSLGGGSARLAGRSHSDRRRRAPLARGPLSLVAAGMRLSIIDPEPHSELDVYI